MLLEAKEKFPCEDLQRLQKIALGLEFGEPLKKLMLWEQDIFIRIKGSPTAEDLRVLQAVVNELNQLQQKIKLTLQSGSEPSEQDNLEIIFAPYRRFQFLDPYYIAHNKGFFSVEQENDRLYSARILISTNKISQAERNHLIREELTQSLGLFNDTRDQPESIFEARWTQVQKYSGQDRRLIQLLYSGALFAGQPAEQIERAFCSHYFSLRCFLPQGPCQKNHEN